MLIYTDRPQTTAPAGRRPGLGSLGMTLADISPALPEWDLMYVLLGAAAVYLAWQLLGNSKSGRKKALYKVRERFIRDEAAIRAQ